MFIITIMKRENDFLERFQYLIKCLSKIAPIIEQTMHSPKIPLRKEKKLLKPAGCEI